VVKIGSSLFCEGPKPDLRRLRDIVREVAGLIKSDGLEVVIVSSGAIALGMHALNIGARPKQLPLLQAAAAVGQNALMDNYSRHFSKLGVKCAQILLTWEDFDSRPRYLNARNTLLELLSLGCVPVINENDTISTEEIKFGDNDRLSALVAKLVEADLLVILSDVDGLLDKDKLVVALVEEINAEIKSLACPSKNRTCVGGMITKLEAAKMSVDSGIPCVIANGRARHIITSAIHKPGSCGTLFVSKKSLTAKEHWIAFGTKPKGKIVVDNGAKQALRNKKSLLSVGVVACSGDFQRDDIVSIVDVEQIEFARGKARLGCIDLDKSKGSRLDKEVIHRDDIVIL